MSVGGRRSRVAAGSPSVVLFGQGPRACAACAWVAGWLSDRGIPFHELDVTRDPVARERLRHATSDQLPVPTLLLPDGPALIWPGPMQLESAFPRARRSA